MPVRRAEYRLAPDAERDLELIWHYTFEEWGLEQAHRYTDELTEAFARLAAKPNIASAADHIRKGYRRTRVGRHVIYIRPEEYGIAVVRVLHDRMLPARHL